MRWWCCGWPEEFVLKFREVRGGDQMEADFQRREAAQVQAHLRGGDIGTAEEELAGDDLIAQDSPLPGHRGR